MPDPKVQQLLTEISQWPEERFFARDSAADRRFEMELSRSTEAGFWAAAPRTLSVEKRDSLPVLLLSHRSAMREWEVAEEANAVLVASVLSAGPLEPSFAFPSTKRWQPGEWGSRHGPPPGAGVQKIFTSRVRTLNAKALCNIPWTSGRVALTYISYDWRSQTLITELTGPAVEATRVSAERASAFRRGLFPEKVEIGRFPSYAASNSHPPVTGQGTAVRIPAKLAASAKSIPALGMMRIKLPAHTLVDGSSADLPVALVPAQILILQLDNPHRGVIPLSVPIYAKQGQKLRAGEIVEAYFAIDLYPNIQPSLEPGEYLCYLIAQEYVSEAVTVVVEAK